ncbi:MAG: synthase delta subunit [Candidatus Saccharibacteria bacterium]|nr:synthase delta subunit [Candidatus Saccharibacteria bacterium]
MSKLPRHDIAKVLAERSLGRVNAKTFSDQIAAYLLSERRTAELEPLLRDIMQYRADQGIVEVIAVSVHPLTAAVRSDIERQVKKTVPTAKQIIISEELQPDLVGGVRLELPNQQLDLSVRAKLSRFKQLTTSGK